MTKYFDKDFWKFLLGFVSILSTSIIIILASRMYQDSSDIQSESQAGNAISSIKNN